MRQKQLWLADKLSPWADALAPLRGVTGSERLHYRDKACLSADWQDGRWLLGLRKRDEIIDIPACPVQSHRVNQVARLLRAHLPAKARFPLAYLAQSGAQTTLVLKTASQPSLDWLTPSLSAEFERTGVEGLWIHLFPSTGKRVFAKNHWYLVWGRARSEDRLGLIHGPAAFSQLLPGLYRQALDQAQAFLAPSANDGVIDLYCGHGSTLQRWRKTGARALGVEVAAEALKCAERNAPGADLLRGTCEHRVPQLRAWRKAASPVASDQPGRRLLYVNPPRTGLEPGVRTWIIDEDRPHRMAYLSCSAGTLSRDLQQLCEAGYRVEALTPYDFFPFTHHVETLALLRRIN
ncbi:class I SAM-dependent RNA methyltransferase [Motiliproteus sp. SC1-56]|uniref:class I SAM-dependent RNA methyltransferase n=1 Tax=Motiliproteus sp. SC1-56 TaxID=2799565 RepID=UPI001A8FE118